MAGYVVVTKVTDNYRKVSTLTDRIEINHRATYLCQRSFHSTDILRRPTTVGCMENVGL